MNHRQRVFEILTRQPGAPLSPAEIVTMSARPMNADGDSIHAMGIDTVTAALKWLVANGKAQKHRRRRDFGYTLVDGATVPPDRRTREGRSNGTA